MAEQLEVEVHPHGQCLQSLAERREIYWSQEHAIPAW